MPRELTFQKRKETAKMGPSHHASLESILCDNDTWPRVTLTGSCYSFVYTGKWPDFPTCAAHGGSLLRSRNQDPQFRFRSTSS